MEQDPRFGKLGQDKITGFKGIVVGLSTWLTGCNQLALAPKHEEGKEMQTTMWFDEGRVEIIGEGIGSPKKVSSPLKGGPNRDAPVRY